MDRLIGDQDSISFYSQNNYLFKNSQTLILSAIDSPFEKAQCLNLGFDEYIAKPFETIELIARIKKLKNRLGTVETNLHFGEINLNLIKKACFVNGTDANLSLKEFEILHLLISNPNKIYTKEKILDLVWNVNTELNTNVVESSINGIRRKLEYLKSNLVIKNKRFVGYWVEK